MPKFPFTNYHELNLDWILKKVTALFDASEENAATIRTYNARLTNAEQTATNAETAATAAQQLADAAAENADSALSVAGTADAKADSALTAATNAAGAASGALTTAQEARQIAASAQSAAADAGALANDASNAAAAAQQTADTNAGNIATLQTAVDTISGKVSDIDNKADVIIDNASGITASFADGADDMPIRSLVTNIEPVQAGSGDSSPTNVRPITGHTGCSVSRVGKNLLNQATRTDGYYIEWNGTIAAYPLSCYSDYIPVEPSTLYNFSFINTVGLTRRIAAYDKNKVWLQQLSYKSVTEGAAVLTCTTTEDTAYVRISYVQSDTDVQFEKGAETSYEPFSEHSISVSWQSVAGTVYGGTLDVISGVLKVDRVMKRLTLAENLSGAYPGSLIWNTQGQSIRDADTSRPFICNRLKYVGSVTTSSNWQYGTCINANGTSFNLWLKDSAFASLADATAWLAENETQLCYYIATPQSYQLTGQQLNTLLGQNNIYSDVGSIANVQYPADTKLYIDGKIAELQALVLEN